MKKLVIAAGTGFLGNILIAHFKTKVDEIVVFTRGKHRQNENIRYVNWNAKTLGPWQNELEDTEALINMTGKSVDCRYHKKNRKLILSSRVDATKILGKAVAACNHPPLLWLNSSTATIYRHSLDKEMGEKTGEIGNGFSVSVARAWETSFFSQPTPQTRKVALRTSIVLGKNGGAFIPILNLVKIGLGGKQGPGNQKFSWIHETDFARSVEHIINTPKIKGPVNIVSPTPTTNEKFMKTLQSVTKTHFALPLPEYLLKFGALVIQTETELILKSRNVIPEKLQENGFEFTFSNLENALKDLTRFMQ